MHDAIQLFSLMFVGKDNRAEFLSVERAVGEQDLWSECSDDVAESARPREDDLTGNNVGVDDGNVVGPEDRGDGGFSSCDSTSQAHDCPYVRTASRPGKDWAHPTCFRRNTISNNSHARVMDFSVVHNDSHPLLRLISDLKSSLNAAQNDAHSSSVRLLRHSLSSSQALERTHALQHENSVLNNELHALRSLFLSNKSPEADRQSINQLTLSLRTLNEKLTATEILLASRTAELLHALGELQKSTCAADTTHQLLACAQRRQEASRARESELELKVRTAEERARMTDRAIGEYANLVRTLQGRTIKEEDIHVHASSHEDLLRQFSQERENLQTQLSSAQTDLALLSSENTALSKSAQVTLAELKDLRVKLQLHERDDATATKMVARYMYA